MKVVLRFVNRDYKRIVFSRVHEDLPRDVYDGGYSARNSVEREISRLRHKYDFRRAYHDRAEAQLRRQYLSEDMLKTLEEVSRFVIRLYGRAPKAEDAERNK